MKVGVGGGIGPFRAGVSNKGLGGGVGPVSVGTDWGGRGCGYLVAFGLIFGASTVWARLACHDWPVTAEFTPPKLTAAGAAPIVVIGTTRDPATPYASAKELASTLTSGVLLTRDGDGHTGYRQGNACIDAAVDGYLLAGAVPTNGKRCT